MSEEQQPYIDGSQTSRQAAQQIGPNARTLEAKVLRYVAARGTVIGATDEEMQDGMKMDGNTCRPRRVKLSERGFVVPNGKKRLTRSNRKAVVYIVTPEGQAWLAELAKLS